MKELILKNGNDGRNTVKPKRRLIMTPIFVEGVKVEDEDMSVDTALDICYTWIADEQGIIVKNFKKP